MSGFLPELGGIVPQGMGTVGGREDVAVVDDGAAAEGFALVLVSAQGLNQADLQRAHVFRFISYRICLAAIVSPCVRDHT